MNKRIVISQQPKDIINFGTEAATTLKEVVSKAGWVVKIKDKDYLQFEAWQTLARFYNYTVKVVETKYVEYGSHKGFEARAIVLDKEGKEIGGAEGGCFTDEENWKNRPLYSLKSMAQTRACAKALRNILSWVVVLAGYKPTPAEEMDADFMVEEEINNDPVIKAKKEFLEKKGIETKNLSLEEIEKKFLEVKKNQNGKR
jgi:hypothetical protein